MVPEAATIMMKSNCIIDHRLGGMSDDFNVDFSTNLMNTQIALEDIIMDVARAEQEETGKPTIVICDRGIFDGKAYNKEEVWDRVLAKQGWNRKSAQKAMDERYDAILHIVTAADGAEEFYGYSNEARYESIEDAVARDKGLRKAYMRHHSYYMIDNQGIGFEEKINQAMNRVQSLVGLPTNINVFKKYLVDTEKTGLDHSKIQWPEDVAVVERMKILETYLQSDERNMRFVRAKDHEEGNVSHQYEKRFEMGGERIQELRQLKQKQYDKLINNQTDTSRRPLEWLRTCFNYKTTYFQLETITNLPENPTILRTASDSAELDLPSFIPIVQEVTDQNEYSSHKLSKIKSN